MEILTPGEVAQELNVTVNLIYRLAKNGKMPGWIRLGDKWVISRYALDRFLLGETKSSSNTSKTP
jgi:excisionase family DNA binding protein